MAELFTMTDLPLSFEAVTTDLVLANYYCWPCRSVHEFGLDDVERIVYALGALEVHAYQVASEDPVVGAEFGQVGPTCLQLVLQAAGDGDMAAEHVEQGIECRQAADQ